MLKLIEQNDKFSVYWNFDNQWYDIYLTETNKIIRIVYTFKEAKNYLKRVKYPYSAIESRKVIPYEYR